MDSVHPMPCKRKKAELPTRSVSLSMRRAFITNDMPEIMVGSQPENRQSPVVESIRNNDIRPGRQNFLYQAGLVKDPAYTVAALFRVVRFADASFSRKKGYSIAQDLLSLVTNPNRRAEILRGSQQCKINSRPTGQLPVKRYSIIEKASGNPCNTHIDLRLKY